MNGLPQRALLSFVKVLYRYFAIVVVLFAVLCSTFNTAHAVPSYTINYQGKLTDNAGLAVPNGTYNMRFWLVDSPTNATTTAEWTESRTGGNKVTVTNGLFSVMLGSVTPLTSVDFNQPLYLGVEIGGSGSPAWDGEMSPRKAVGTVPSAFEAKQLGGVASTSFLRSDAADSASGLLTFTGGMISTASSTVARLSFLNATGTSLYIGGDRITEFAGDGLVVSGGSLQASLGGNVSAAEMANGDHGFFSYSSGVASLDTGGITSADLLAALTNETGTGVAVFNASPVFDATLTVLNNSSTATLNISGVSSVLNLGTAGVRLTEDGDGAITFLGLGNGSDEDLTMNLDDTSNEVVFTTSTGITKASFSSIALNTTSASGYQISGTTYFAGDLTNDSVRVGELAGATFDASDIYNVAIGYEAGRYASTSAANYNNYIGYQAGRSNKGNDNNVFGTIAGYNLNGNYNNIIGNTAGYNNTGSYNSVMGYAAGEDNTGDDNTILGDQAGDSNAGDYNNLFGYRSGYTNTGDFNEFIGSQTGYINNGDYNQLMGYQAGRYLQSTSTVAIGGQALYGSHATTYISLNNVAVGYRAGYASDDGSGSNILIGYQAADNLTTGNNNIIIGYDIDNVTATADNSLNIGNLIFGTGLDGTGTTLASGNVGIGTSSPYARLSTQLTSTSATAANTYASAITMTDTGVITTGTDRITGQVINVTRSGSTGGTMYATGQEISLIGGTTGATGHLTGLSVESNPAGGINSNTGAYIAAYGGTYTVGTEIYVDNAGDGSAGLLVSHYDYGSGSTNTKYGTQVVFDDSGSSGGTDTNYASYIDLTSWNGGAANNSYGQYITADVQGSAIVNAYGQYIDLVGGTTGTSTNYGSYVTVSGADTNYSGIFTGGNFGIGDTTPASLFTVGSGDLFQINSSGVIASSNNITPNSILSSGQTDEYCLTYESTGTTFAWQACGTGSLSSADIDTSAELAAILTDETGSAGGGLAVFSISPTITGTADFVAGDFSSTLTMSGSAANIVLGSNYLSGDGGDEGVFVSSAGNVGIGTSTPVSKLDVYGFVNVDGYSGYKQDGQLVLYSTTTSLSTAVGYLSGRAISTNAGMYGNNAFGYRALSSLSLDGDSNNAFGAWSLSLNTTGSYNNAFGESALSSNTTGDTNNAFGGTALYDNTSGYSNSAFGDSALGNNTTGYYNDAFGYTAMAFNVGGYENVAVGRQSLFNNTNGIRNVAIGSQAARGTGSYSATGTVAIGYQAGYNMTTGADYNVLLGYKAGENLTTGNNNIIIGYDIDNVTATADNRLNIGNLIFGTGLDGTGTTTSSGNVGIGTSTPYAKFSIHTSNGSTENMLFAIGSSTASTISTLFSVDNEGDTLALGNLTIRGTGRSTIATNLRVGPGSNSAIPSTAEGIEANSSSGGRLYLYRDDATTVLDDNLGVINFGSNDGATANASVISSYAATSFSGTNSGSDLRFGTTLIGTNAPSERMRITDAGNVGIGTTTPNQLLTVQGNINLSSPTGSIYFDDTKYIYASSTNDSLVFGENAGLNFTASTVYSVAIGSFALDGTNPGLRNVAVGSFALGYTNPGSYNVAVGSSAGGVNSATDINNVFVGYAAGADSGATYSTVIGANASHDSYAAYSNIIGYFASRFSGAASSTVIGNNASEWAYLTDSVAIGTESVGHGNAVDNSVILGSRAGYTLDGNNNILIGYAAGDTMTTASNNILIGYDIDAITATADNRLNIGNLIFGTGLDGTGTTLSSGNIGIGTSTPSGKLHTYLTESGTTAATTAGNRIDMFDTGVVTTGTDNPVGNLINVTRSGATGGTINASGQEIFVTGTAAGSAIVESTGVYAEVTGNNTGTSTANGFYSYVHGADTLYGVYNLIADSSASTIRGVRNDIYDTGTTANQLAGEKTTIADTGVVTTGTDTTYGNQIEVTRTGATGGTLTNYGNYTTLTGTFASGSGTINNYGSLISVTGSTAGTATNYGVHVTVSGADTNYSGIFTGGNFGVGDTTPAALFTVGSGDLFQVNSSGYATAPRYYGGSAASSQLILRSTSGSGTTDDIIMGIGTDGATQAFRIDNENNSVTLGEFAGATFAAGTDRNVAIGYEAGRYASTTGSDSNNMIGWQAGYRNTSNYNNMMGYRAGYQNSGADNNLIGEFAGEANTGSQNNALGYYAGFGNTGFSNNFMGSDAGEENTGHYNNLFGYYAGQMNSGNYNNIFGYQAGYENPGDYNNFIGYEAGAWTLEAGGSYNDFIGYQAGRYANGTSSVAIGAGALSGQDYYVAINNTAIGYQAGYNATGTANNNILLGYRAADNLTTGNNNIIIGYDIDNITATADNRLNIGNLIFGSGIDGTGTTTSSGNIGIGTSTPDAKLNVKFTDTGTTADNLYGVNIDVDDTGVVTTGADETWGQLITMNRSGATGGTIDSRGLYVQSVADNAGSGTSNNYSGAFYAEGGDNVTAISGTIYEGASTGNSGTSTGLSLFVIDGGTTADKNYGIYNEVTEANLISSGSDTTYGSYTKVSRTVASGGTLTNYGDYISVTGTTAGTQTNYGTYVTVSGADTNYSGIFMGGNFGIGDATPSQLFDVDGTNVQALFEESTTEFLRTGVGETAGTSVVGWDDSDTLRLGVYDSPTDTTISTLLSVGSTGATSFSPLTTFTTGTGISYAAAGATTLSGAYTAMSMNLNALFTATGQSMTGYEVMTPSVTNTGAGTYNYKGLVVTGNNLTQNTAAGIDTFTGVYITNSNITQTTGTVFSNGVSVTTGTITTGGTQQGFDVRASGVGAGSLYGLNVGSITADAGTEYAVNIGTGWDRGINSLTTGLSYFAGNVGIGTTSTAAHLTVQSTGTNDILNLFETGGTEVFSVLESGYVGIGTSTPNNILELGSDKNISFQNNPSSSGYYGMRLKSGTGGAFSMFHDNASNTLNFGYAGTANNGINTHTKLFTIDENGDVGIGDNNPGSRLEVYKYETATTSANGALSAYLYADPTGTSDASYLNYIGTETSGSQNMSASSVYGLYMDAWHGGTGTLSDAHGIDLNVTKGDTGVISDAYGINISIDNTNASGAITRGYGLYIDSMTRTGAITESWGVYVEDTTAENYFGGNVGIGDLTPDVNLDVEGSLASENIAHFFNDGNNANRWGIRVQGGADDGTGTTYYLDARDGDGTQIGYLANTSGTFAVTDVSDVRTKTNITNTEIVDATAVINALRVVDFNRIDNPDGPRITGFIAQEVEPLYPYAITEGPDGMLGLMKDAFIPLLVKGAQEQQSSITTLGDTLLETIQSVADLEAMVSGSLSEYYGSEDDTLEAGELVTLATSSDASIARATVGSQLFGVVTEGTGITLGEGNDNTKPVALTGRTQVKVNNEGGDIEIGDAIALSSEAGVGTKATTTTRVIGTALESFDDNEGTILVFIEPRTHFANNEPTALASLFAPIGSQVEDTLWNRLTTLATNFVEGVLTVAGIRTEELCVGEVCVDEETFLEIVEQAGQTPSAPPSSSESEEAPPEDETGEGSDSPEPIPEPEPEVQPEPETTPEPEVTPDPEPTPEPEPVTP